MVVVEVKLIVGCTVDLSVLQHSKEMVGLFVCVIQCGCLFYWLCAFLLWSYLFWEIGLWQRKLCVGVVCGVTVCCSLCCGASSSFLWCVVGGCASLPYLTKYVVCVGLGWGELCIILYEVENDIVL